MNVDDILTRLESVRRVGDGWQALCPAHDDQNPSLSINVGDDGRILLHCYAGCATEAIVRVLGLELADLFACKPDSKKSSRKIAATYDYLNAEGQLLYQVVRYSPKDFSQRRPDGNSGWIYNLNGIRRVLYRLPEVIAAAQKGETIYVCEGEKDVESLRELGLVATTNSGGAGKWRDEYSEFLRSANIVVLPDKDEPGLKHTAQVTKSVHGKAASLKIIELPGNCKDVTDWLQAGGAKEALLKLVEQATLWQPARSLSYQELLAVFQKWLFFHKDTPIRFILCAVIANRLRSDPFWAFIVAPSGSAKTELLNALTSLEFVTPLDTLTANTFLSGKQRKDPNASLLLRLPYGAILLMRDFTSVLEMHREKRDEIFSQLRKIYDGHLSRATGDGGDSAHLNWKGKIGLIAGVTPAVEGYRAFATTLGERFLYYYLPPVDRQTVATIALKNREHLRAMREELQNATKRFVDGLQIPSHIELPEAFSQYIVKVADFVSRVRTGVARNYYSSTREITDLPDPEIPTRLAQQIGCLACAHAVLNSREIVQVEDLELVLEVALGCIPTRRRLVLQLLAQSERRLMTSDLAEAINLPTATVRRDLEDLTVLQLVKRIKQGEGQSDLWVIDGAAREGWNLITSRDALVTVKKAHLEKKEVTLSEKSGGMNQHLQEEDDDTTHYLPGDFSDKVGSFASGSTKLTVTQVSEEELDDIPCPF